MSPMGLGASWADAYVEPQQKKQSSLMFINLLTTIHQMFPRINPMGIGDPWANDYI